MKIHKPFALIYLHFWILHEISNVLKKRKKNEPPWSIISEVIDSEICAYLNA